MLLFADLISSLYGCNANEFFLFLLEFIRNKKIFKFLYLLLLILIFYEKLSMVSCVFSFYLWYSYVFSIINNTLSFNVNYKRDINNVFIIILPLNSFKNKPCRFIKMRERRSWIGLESMSQHSNRFLIKIPNTPSK